MSSRGASAGKGAVAQQQQRKRRKGGNRKGGSRASDEAAAPAAAAYQYQSFTEEDSDSDGEDVLAALKDYSDKTPEVRTFMHISSVNFWTCLEGAHPQTILLV